MITIINIYSNQTTDFSGNGIAVIHDAQDICIKHEINGNYELTFSLRKKSPKWAHVVEENIVKCNGELFRIKTISGGNITATAIYYDASYHHIPYIGDMIGVTPRAIMLALFEGTSVHVMTTAEVAAKNLEWVTTPTDFFETGKITAIGGMDTLVKTLNEQNVHCELYIDNYNIALVKQIGKDNGYNIDLTVNAKSINVQRDTTSIVNRVYPYGKDDLDISTYHGTAYIDSQQSIKKYGVREGYVDFSDIDKPKDLYNAGIWQFSADNVDRIDVPKYSITVDFLELERMRGYAGTHKINLGDTVTVYDRDYYNTTTKQRVTAISYYPYEPNKTKYTVGNALATVSKIFDGVVAGQAQYNRTIDSTGNVKTSWIECLQRNESILINNTLASKKDIARYKTGALFVASDDSCAVAIIDGKIALSSQKNNNEWVWTTTADSGKIIVGETFTGTLYTEKCAIKGVDGQLDITNNVLKFTDSKGIARLYMGISTLGDYMFQMRDKKGNMTMYINDNGEAVFSGNVETLKDAIVGATLTLKDIGGSVGATININGTRTVGAGYETVLQMRSKAGRGIDIDAYTDGDSNLILRGKNIMMGTPDGTSGKIYANGGVVATQEWVQQHFGS